MHIMCITTKRRLVSDILVYAPCRWQDSQADYERKCSRVHHKAPREASQRHLLTFSRALCIERREDGLRLYPTKLDSQSHTPWMINGKSCCGRYQTTGSELMTRRASVTDTPTRMTSASFHSNITRLYLMLSSGSKYNVGAAASVGLARPRASANRLCVPSLLDNMHPHHLITHLIIGRTTPQPSAIFRRVQNTFFVHCAPCRLAARRQTQFTILANLTRPLRVVAQRLCPAQALAIRATRGDTQAGTSGARFEYLPRLLSPFLPPVARLSPPSLRLHKASDAQHSATQPAQAPVLARRRGDTQAGTVRGRASLQGGVGPSQSCSPIQSSGGRVPCVYSSYVGGVLVSSLVA